MDIDENTKKTVVEMVKKALLDIIADINLRFFAEEVYGFAIYSSGFDDVGVAYNTRSELQRQGAEAESIYFELNACEWSFFEVGKCDQVNNFMNENNDRLLDAGLDPDDLYDFWRCTFTYVLSDLKRDGFFRTKAFATDLFLSIQFPHGCNDEVTLDSSKFLNSKAWHEKLSDYIEELEDE